MAFSLTHSHAFDSYSFERRRRRSKVVDGIKKPSVARFQYSALIQY